MHILIISAFKGLCIKVMKSKTQVLLFISILAAGGAMLFAPGHVPNSFAVMPEQPSDDITVIPLQTARDGYGLAMIDRKTQTIWVYEINSRSSAYNKLRLIAARSYRYDRLLDEFNTGQPKPDEVKRVVEQLLKPGAKDIDQSKVLEPNKPKDVNLF